MLKFKQGKKLIISLLCFMLTLIAAFSIVLIVSYSKSKRNAMPEGWDSISFADLINLTPDSAYYTDNDEFIIESVVELSLFSASVSNGCTYEGKKVTLIADLDWTDFHKEAAEYYRNLASDYSADSQEYLMLMQIAQTEQDSYNSGDIADWSPIGSRVNTVNGEAEYDAHTGTFMGVFDGGGHTISNLKTEIKSCNTDNLGGDDSMRIGFFGSIGGSSDSTFEESIDGTLEINPVIIKNIKIKDYTISNYNTNKVGWHMAGLVSYATGPCIIENCIVENVTLNANKKAHEDYFGGIVCVYGNNFKHNLFSVLKIKNCMVNNLVINPEDPDESWFAVIGPAMSWDTEADAFAQFRNDSGLEYYLIDEETVALAMNAIDVSYRDEWESDFDYYEYCFQEGYRSSTRYYNVIFPKNWELVYPPRHDIEGWNPAKIMATINICVYDNVVLHGYNAESFGLYNTSGINIDRSDIYTWEDESYNVENYDSLVSFEVDGNIYAREDLQEVQDEYGEDIWYIPKTKEYNNGCPYLKEFVKFTDYTFEAINGNVYLNDLEISYLIVPKEVTLNVPIGEPTSTEMAEAASRFIVYGTEIKTSPRDSIGYNFDGWTYDSNSQTYTANYSLKKFVVKFAQTTGSSKVSPDVSQISLQYLTKLELTYDYENKSIKVTSGQNTYATWSLTGENLKYCLDSSKTTSFEVRGDLTITPNIILKEYAFGIK